MNAEHDLMEERAHQCRRLARVLREDLVSVPVDKLPEVLARIKRYEVRAEALEKQLKKARGY